MALSEAKLPALLVRIALIAGLVLAALALQAGSAHALCKESPCPLPPEGEFVANLHTEVTGPATAFRDQQATYTFTVGNEGQRTAESVDLEVQVPAGATYVSASRTCSTAPRDGGTKVTCALGSIRSGHSETTAITVTPTAVGSVTISGVALSDTPEDLPDDDADSLTTQVYAPPQPYADLATTLSDSRDPVSVGSEFTYHARVTNRSVVIGLSSFGPIGPFDYPDTAQNVQLTDKLPDGVELVRTSRPYDCSSATNEHAETTVTCGLGAIDPNLDYEEVDIVVRATATGAVTNTATATSDTNDPDAANNGAVVTTSLREAPTVSVDDISVAEGAGPYNTNATFRLTLSRPADETTAVAFHTTDGTAKSPWDYWSTAGQIVLQAGEQTKDINVPVVGDDVDEPDEDFTLLLVGSQGVTLPDDRAVATIQDDDEGPSLSVAETTADEGEPATFTVSLSQTSTFDVTVDASTKDGSAKQPGDYTARSGRITIPAGELSTTVPVDVVDDPSDEPDEEFTLNLADPEHGTIGDSAAHATITDNDGPPALSVADTTAAEGNTQTSPATFTVALSQASGFDVSFDATTHDGTATASTATSRGDYNARTGRVTIPAGQTTAEVPVAIVGDTRDEPDEQFTLDLTDPVQANVADGSAAGTITDDDEPGDPPETTIATGPGQWSATPRPSFDFEATEDDATFECRVVPDSFAACTTPWSTRPLADGPHTAEVRAVKHEADGSDVRDIPDPTPASATFIVDTVAPTTTIAAAPPALSNNSTPTFELRSGDPLAHLECRVTGTAYRGCSATETLARLADGEYLFEARAVDPAGNADASPAAHRFVIDTIPPETRIGGSRVSPPPTISGAAGTNRVAVGGSGQAMLAVGCPAGAQASCEGDVAIDANGVRVGQDSFDVAPGQNQTVPVDLPPSVQSGVERDGAVNVVVTTILEEPPAKATARARRAARIVEREDMVLTPDPRTPRLRDAGRTLVPRKGTLAIRLSCPRERGAAGCAGRLRILNAREKSLGTGSFKLRAGQSRSTKLKLTRSAVRALRGRRSLDAVVEVTTRQAGAQPVVKRIQIQLRGGRR